MPTTTTESRSITFPVAATLDIGFNLMEDRLILAARPQDREKRLALLTRHMLDILLAHTVRILEQTTPSAARVPEGHRDEVLQMEHIGAVTAVQGAPDQAAAVGGGAEAEGPPTAFLVTEIKFQVAEDHVVVGFLGRVRHAAGGDGLEDVPVWAMRLDRANLHRVLALLRDKAREAKWGLEPDAAWMKPPAARSAEDAPTH